MSPGQRRVYKKRADVHRSTRVETPEPKKAQSRARLKEDLDALLADVDEALEGIEEDFATKYLQKGGQ